MPKKFNKVKDSGKTTKFTTGSHRDCKEGKGRYDLLSPIAIRRLAEHYENGAKRYNPRNWEKGQPLSGYLDSALRHIFAILEGKKDEDHPSAAMWNMAAYIHTEEKIIDGDLPKILDDLPKNVKKKTKRL